MSITITIKNGKIGGDFEAFKNAKITGNVQDIIFDLINSDVEKSISIMENANINSMEEALAKALLDMDHQSAEYQSLQRLLAVEPATSKHAMCKRILDHVKSFSEGVAASIVASYIMK